MGFGLHPSQREIESRLRITGAAQGDFHAAAAAAAAARFDRQVFVRGVVEVTNYCREDCLYCGMRRSNRRLDRSRAAVDRLAELVIHRRPASIRDLTIQGGEDPRVVEEVVLPLLAILRRETSLGMIVCLGTLSRSDYRALRGAGAAAYIMKFETANPGLYRSMRGPGTLPERLAHIRDLAADGWFVSSGFIAGLPGETDSDGVRNLRCARSLPLYGCSVSPFIPGTETPLRAEPSADADLTLNCMAALRLLRPDWVIPAVSALDLADREAGYHRGLRAGANLVTINLTPPDLRNDYLLYTRDRCIITEDRALRAMAAAGLAPANTGVVDHYQRQPLRAADSPTPAPASPTKTPELIPSRV